MRLDETATAPTSGLKLDRRLPFPAAAPVTLDGVVVGTPAYMPPEQAMGTPDSMGPRSDVYSVGAMLYHLLSGRLPYQFSGEVLDNELTCRRVRAGPPESLERIAPRVPAELVAICEKAMAREQEERYASMLSLAEDLRAYLEGRVVRAYRIGAWAEFRKWVARNRALATASAAALLLAFVGSVAVGYVQSRGRRAAERQETIARQEHANVLRLSAFQELADLQQLAERLWPPHPRHRQSYTGWLARARELVAGLYPSEQSDDPGHLEQLRLLRARTVEREAASARAGAPLPASSQRERGLPRRERGLPQRERGLIETLSEQGDRWWTNQLDQLVQELRTFADAETGLIAGSSAESGWGIERRLSWANRVAQLTVDGPDVRRAWEEACAAIASAELSPVYGGLRIAPQLGLVPLGADPRSGLWEFAHPLSGSVPKRDGAGELVLTGDTALVFVLLPGGSFWMGAQSDDPEAPNFDPQAQPEERPVHRIELAPFFLSKYEMTQAQWQRFTGENPSQNRLRAEAGSSTDLALHPVEQVSWEECERLTRRMGLALPTEAQWEYAARAGTGTPWFTGRDPEHLVGHANLADRFCRDNGGPPGWSYEPWDDGHAPHAKVGSFSPNTFGLHDMHGNVFEWCRDAFQRDYYGRSPSLDPLCSSPRARFRVHRGGGFDDAAALARSAARFTDEPGLSDHYLGLRPARAIAEPRESD